MISTLLGLTDKPIFEILYRSAYRAMFRLEPNITLRPFTTQVIRQAKAEKLKLETIDMQLWISKRPENSTPTF